MLTKEEIARRFRVLEEAAEAAGKAASDKEMRHTRASQGTERLGLRTACKAHGGHMYFDPVGFDIDACLICGAPKDEPAAILARNLGTVSSLDKFAPEVISKAPDALPAAKTILRSLVRYDAINDCTEYSNDNGKTWRVN